MEMSKSELEDFDVSGRVLLGESVLTCNIAKKATLNIPEDRVDDDKTVKCPFALPDELVAKVLGYLPLRDRYRLEVVCRQWQRCMYLEVRHLYVKLRHEVDQQYTMWIKNVGKITASWTKELSAVLHKLRMSKVGHLKYDVQETLSDRELLVLLADIASKATEVEAHYGICYSPANLLTFCDIIGPHVTTFQLRLHQWQKFPEDVQAFADSFVRMKRLKKLGSNWLDLIFTCLNNFPISSLPQFQEIEAEFNRECDWKLWEDFKNLYGTQLKKITFPGSVPCLDDQHKVLLPWKDMAPFANLKHLDFVFRPTVCTLPALAEDLEAISRNCPLLKSLRLTQAAIVIDTFVASVTELQKFFVAIGKMKTLEKLDLFLSFYIRDLREVSSRENLDLFALLENKSNITHLEADLTIYQICSQNEPIQYEIFGSLNNAMPNLRHLDVGCMASELDHFVGLERMQTIRLYYLYSEEASESIQDRLIRILKSSPALKNIEIHHEFAEVSENFIRAIIDVAKLQMEKHIDFIAKIGVCDKSPKVWEAMKHLAPRNLTLTLDSVLDSDSE